MAKEIELAETEQAIALVEPALGTPATKEPRKAAMERKAEKPAVVAEKPARKPDKPKAKKAVGRKPGPLVLVIVWLPGLVVTVLV